MDSILVSLVYKALPFTKKRLRLSFDLVRLLRGIHAVIMVLSAKSFVSGLVCWLSRLSLRCSASW